MSRSRAGFGAGVVALLLVSAGLAVAFGWPMPNRQRAWDEKYTLDNARRILASGEMRPATGFHPALSYLPQTAVLAAVDACGCTQLGTGAASVLEVGPAGRDRGRRAGVELTPLAYRACRLTSAAFSVLAVLLLALLGRRLSSPAVGLVAAALFAGAPWMVWASGICNEDAGLVLATIVVAAATLAALERPGARRFLLAGGAVGLALATKFNAGPLALPLTLVSFWRARRQRRYLLWLALAGLAAVAVFLLLDLHYLVDFGSYSRDFLATLRDYERKGRRQGHGLLEVLGLGLAAPADALYLGLAGGALALAGALLVAVRRERGGEAGGASGAWRALLLFPLCYVATYALATRNVSPHNWLPVLPFAALLAAEATVALASAIRSRLSSRAGAIAAGGALALVALAGLARGAGYVYATLVPPTYEAAVEAVAARLEHGATLIHDVEPDDSWVGRRGARTRLVEQHVPALGEVAVERLGAADALVSKEGKDEISRLAGAGAELLTIGPRWMVSRGPSLTIAIRPWRIVSRRSFDLGRPEAVTGRGPRGRGRKRILFRGMRRIPAPPGASHFSLEIPLRGISGAPRCELVAGGGRRPLLVPTRRSEEAGEVGVRAFRGTRLELVSERLPVSRLPNLALRCAPRAAKRFGRRPELLFWSAAESGSRPSSRTRSGRGRAPAAPRPAPGG